MVSGTDRLLADQPHHGQAAAMWRELLERDEPLVATNYVVVETYALGRPAHAPVRERLGGGQ